MCHKFVCSIENSNLIGIYLPTFCFKLLKSVNFCCKLLVVRQSKILYINIYQKVKFDIKIKNSNIDGIRYNNIFQKIKYIIYVFSTFCFFIYLLFYFDLTKKQLKQNNLALLGFLWIEFLFLASSCLFIFFSS